jgi:hypothetical protein
VAEHLKEASLSLVIKEALMKFYHLAGKKQKIK